MKVFLSWSGPRSHNLALALHGWLPTVIQAVEPFVSSEDIHKGTRWVIEMGAELEKASFGILCVVPTNVDAPWLNFEAGALSKFVQRSRVVPLLFEVPKTALREHPLSQFQYAEFKKEELLKVIKSINELLGADRVKESVIQASFEQAWPALVDKVQSVPSEASESVAAVKPAVQPTEEIDETERKILAIWADRPADQKLSIGHVAGILKISEQRAQFYVNELIKKKYLHDIYSRQFGAQYLIEQKGREFLVRNGLA